MVLVDSLVVHCVILLYVLAQTWIFAECVSFVILETITRCPPPVTLQFELRCVRYYGLLTSLYHWLPFILRSFNHLRSVFHVYSTSWRGTFPKCVQFFPQSLSSQHLKITSLAVSVDAILSVECSVKLLAAEAGEERTCWRSPGVSLPLQKTPPSISALSLDFRPFEPCTSLRESSFPLMLWGLDKILYLALYVGN